MFIESHAPEALGFENVMFLIFAPDALLSSSPLFRRAFACFSNAAACFALSAAGDVSLALVKVDRESALKQSPSKTFRSIVTVVNVEDKEDEPVNQGDRGLRRQHNSPMVARITLYTLVGVIFVLPLSATVHDDPAMASIQAHQIAPPAL